MVAEAVALAVGGAFLSSFLNVLFEKVADFLEGPLIKFFQKTDLTIRLLQKMEIMLLTVDEVLGEAEEKQIMNPSVKKWLDKLKDAAYDADDLLDATRFGGQVEKKQVKDFNTRLEQIVSTLELIVKDKDILSLKEAQGRKSISRLPTTSLVDESEVCFRNDDKKHLLDILLSDGVNGKGIPVIAIVGMGGIGKTTLAQFLYNDEKVKNHFNLRAWVHVSEEFDVFKVTKTIYESATLSRCDIEDLNALQVTLEWKLKAWKFLLVLDNVWNESSREWDLLRRPLQVGAVGSKIIVTTRSQSVSSTIRAMHVHDLKMLSPEDCWSLFTKHAFGDKDPDEDSTLKEIGKRIVEKCKGLPLAVKTLGSLLYSEAEGEEWNNVLNSRIWDLPDHKSDILPALRLSYHFLPSQLKRCFAYCSIFPKGHKFEKGDLIRMWKAEGLVQQPNSRRTREEVGEQYFHELLSRSIFQRSDPSCFMMHDLVSDLAEHVAGQFCFNFEHDSPPQHPARVRHLSCIWKPSDTIAKFERFYGQSNVLRTLLLFKSGGKAPFNIRVLQELFKEPSCLRVLLLPSNNITEFPDSVMSNLKHLRYLNLSGASAITSLPESVGCLYYLETLKLSGCHCLTQLPPNLGNLTKLEHLDMNGAHSLESIDSIGDLKQLGYLDLSGTQVRCLPGGVCSLSNLRTLKLSGCSRLTCLPTNMEKLTKLKHLDMNGTAILELLDSIGDLKQLGYLDLSGTQVRCLPGGVCSLSNLQTLKLSGCSQLTCLPTNMENLNKLGHLDMNGACSLEFIDSIGYLKQLGYLDLSGTQVRCLPGGVCSLPNLQTLKLSRCSQLTCLPTDMEKLTKLKHFDMNGTPILELLDSIGDLKQLGYLDLSGTQVRCLPGGVCSLSNLQTLKLSGCSQLTCLPTNMENLTKLKHLDIKGTRIQQMPQDFGKLKRLQLLTNFVMGKDGGSSISELKDLSLLRGTLSISGLQNVSQTTDAEKANLKDKKYLRELIFEWDADPCNGTARNAAHDPQNGNTENAQNGVDDLRDCDGQNAVNDPLNGNKQNAADDLSNGNLNNAENAAEIVADNRHNGNTQNAQGAMGSPQITNGQSAAEDDHAANVLGKLQPGEHLESLEIKNFFGTRLPNWLGCASFCKMNRLVLQNCQNCNKLPPLGQLPSLKHLVIVDLGGVKTVGDEFYGDGDPAFKSLDTLIFKRMENWKTWSLRNERDLPFLRQLCLEGCGILSGIPIQRPGLALQIQGCDGLGTTNQ